MKKTKRSLFTSLVTLLLCSAMFVGSTFAWFTDTVSNTGNRIQAGTLKVDLLMDKELGGIYTSIAGGKGDIFKEDTVAQDSNVTLWEPGKTQIVYLAVKNKGNLALKYNIYLDVTDEGLIVGKDSKETSLEYAIIPGAKATDPVNANNWTELKALAQTGDVEFEDPTHTYERLPAAPNGKIFASDDAAVNTQYFALAVHMKEDAGNEYQGKDAIIDVAVVATQATAEEDGFGNKDYDVQADYDEIPAPIHEKAEKTISDNQGSSDINFETKPGSKIENANIQGEAANAILEAAKAGTDVTDNVTVDLSMNIDTAEKTSNSITFDITLDKIVKINDVVNDAKSGLVTDLGDKVASVTLNIGTGLSNVKVNRKHNGTSTPLEELVSVDEKKDGFFYDGSTGKLTITSSKYSDFICEYDVCNHEHIGEWVCDSKNHSATCPDCGAVIKAEHKYNEGICICGYKSDVKLLEENPNFTCRIGNDGYELLIDALGVAKKTDNRNIVLINSMEVSSGINFSGCSETDKDRYQYLPYTIDFNGKNITVNNGTINLNDGTFNLVGDGAIQRTGTKGAALQFNTAQGHDAKKSTFDTCPRLIINNVKIIDNCDELSNSDDQFIISSKTGMNLQCAGSGDSITYIGLCQINGGTFHNIVFANVKCEINQGNFTGFIYIGTGDSASSPYASGVKDEDLNIVINGGTFNISGFRAPTKKEYHWDIVEAGNDKVKIIAGDFNIDPSKYVDTTISNIQQVEDRWIVTKK